jgi:hypothetical protein
LENCGKKGFRISAIVAIATGISVIVSDHSYLDEAVRVKF